MLLPALTDEHPFSGKSAEQVLEKQAVYVPLEPHCLNPAIPTGISSCIMRLLQKDPDERNPGVPAFLEDFCRDDKTEGQELFFPCTAGRESVNHRQKTGTFDFSANMVVDEIDAINKIVMPWV